MSVSPSQKPSLGCEQWVQFGKLIARLEIWKVFYSCCMLAQQNEACKQTYLSSKKKKKNTVASAEITFCQKVPQPDSVDSVGTSFRCSLSMTGIAWTNPSLELYPSKGHSSYEDEGSRWGLQFQEPILPSSGSVTVQIWT